MKRLLLVILMLFLIFQFACNTQKKVDNVDVIEINNEIQQSQSGINLNEGFESELNGVLNAFCNDEGSAVITKVNLDNNLVYKINGEFKKSNSGCLIRYQLNEPDNWAYSSDFVFDAKISNKLIKNFFFIAGDQDGDAVWYSFDVSQINTMEKIKIPIYTLSQNPAKWRSIGDGVFDKTKVQWFEFMISNTDSPQNQYEIIIDSIEKKPME
ncbi:MAG TPA: hypothetical protein PK843_16400 [bacterium]|nr:hypothetical protein [bacterium]